MVVGEYHLTDQGQSRCGAKTEDGCPFRDRGHYANAPMAERAFAELMESEGLGALSNTVSSRERPDPLVGMIQDAELSRSNRDSYGDRETTEAQRALIAKIGGALSSSRLMESELIRDPDRDDEDNLVPRLSYRTADGDSVKFFAYGGILPYRFRENPHQAEGDTINALNSYRLSQAMGGSFTRLIPETAPREIDGILGVVQVSSRGAADGGDSQSPLRGEAFEQDRRSAAIFDYVTGNFSRSMKDYTVDSQGEETQVRLTENGASFPDSHEHVKEGVFTRGAALSRMDRSSGKDRLKMLSRKLSTEERISVERAREAVQRWGRDGTMDSEQARLTIVRIDTLLKARGIPSLGELSGRAAA